MSNRDIIDIRKVVKWKDREALARLVEKRILINIDHETSREIAHAILTPSDPKFKWCTTCKEEQNQLDSVNCYSCNNQNKSDEVEVQ